jgi:hypothetical protein
VTNDDNGIINDTRNKDVRLVLNTQHRLDEDLRYYIHELLEQAWEYGYEFGYSRGTVNADE